MKKIKLLLLLLMLSGASAYSQLQQIKIVSFTVKNQLPAVIDNWGNMPGSLLLVAQLPPTVRVKGIRLMVQIKGGGAIICSNNSAGGLQVDEFTTRTFSANELTGSLQGCHDLKDGNYSICVQFYNVDRVAISNEVCKEFTVETPKEIDYSPPTLINPENGKNYTEAELSRPVTFRWTPLVPKPREPVTYRLKVWQLMQGQNGTQAMRSNQPIVTKDVDNITQAVVNGIYTGPCKPPYLCDFIWMVQALNKEGKPMGRNEGNSEPYTFNVKQNEGGKLKNIYPEDKKQFTQDDAKNNISFRWTPLVPKPREPVTYRLKVWQLMQGQNGSQAMRTNKPIVVKEVLITEVGMPAISIYTGPCKPPYLCDFIWSVEAIVTQATGTTQVIGSSEPTIFNVKESNSPVTIKNVFPEENKSFSFELFFDGFEENSNVKKSLPFKWTPVTPKPQEPVTYRLKVWQLMQGQNGTQAMKVNKPIVEKEFQDILIDMKDQTMKAAVDLYTGPCKPPYLCDFIWNVEAITKQAGATPKVIATSNPTMFFVTQYIIQLDSIKVSCTNKPGVYSFSYTITNPNAGPATLNLFTVTSSVPAGATLSSFTPPVNTVINAGNQLTITGTINGAPNLSNICIGAEIKDVGNAFWKASKDTCVNVLPCKCEDCDEKHFTFTAAPPPVTISNNTISFNQAITVTTTPAKTIKTIKAELVYYEMVPENDMCIPCNKDAATYGHFTNGTNSQEWNGPQQNLNISITTPQLTPCCSAVFKWCIRYKIEFTDCTTCNKLVCYEKRKEGCEKVNPDKNQK